MAVACDGKVFSVPQSRGKITAPHEPWRELSWRYAIDARHPQLGPDAFATPRLTVLGDKRPSHWCAIRARDFERGRSPLEDAHPPAALA